MFHMAAMVTFWVGMGIFGSGLGRWLGNRTFGRQATPRRVERWICPEEGCPQSYIHARYLARHMMDVHPDLLPMGL
jgi:hypothetical protein